MSRRRRCFVPTMDHLGFRVMPSGIAPMAVYASNDGDECYIPGENTQVTPSLTWDTPTDPDTPLIGSEDTSDVNDTGIKGG